MEPSKPKRKIGRWIALALVALVLAVVALFWKTYQEYAGLLQTGSAGTLPQSYDFNGDSETEEKLNIQEKDVYNLLVAVIDNGVEEEDRDYGEGMGNTDVLLFIRFDNKTHEMNILQIPRDTYVGDIAVDCGAAYKINGAFMNGQNRENPIANTSLAVYQLFGLKADNYVVLDVQAFRTMIDTMGGIWMNIPRDIYLDDAHTQLLIGAGDVKLSGEMTEIILRNRKTGLADYGRLELQQSFYAAVFKTFMEKYPMSDALKVAKNVAYYMNTDLSVMDLVGLYSAMKNLTASDIYFVRCGGGPINITGKNGSSVSAYGVEKESMAAILNEHFRPEGVVIGADKLGLPDVEFPLGYNVDEGKRLSDVGTAEIQD